MGLELGGRVAKKLRCGIIFVRLMHCSFKGLEASLKGMRFWIFGSQEAGPEGPLPGASRALSLSFFYQTTEAATKNGQAARL